MQAPYTHLYRICIPSVCFTPVALLSNLCLGDRSLPRASPLSRHKVPSGSGAHMMIPSLARAPEALWGDYTNYPVDMWACGCLLEELAHVRVSFRGKSLYHVIDNIYKRFGTPTPPHPLTKLWCSSTSLKHIQCPEHTRTDILSQNGHRRCAARCRPGFGTRQFS